MTPLAAYLLLFLAVGVGFIFVHLLAGKLIRPARPHSEKETIYECGEPTIGSAWVQFDLRFYVVALLFVIFDVEVAFFFPWAEVFGKANAIATTPTEAINDVRRKLDQNQGVEDDDLERARAEYKGFADKVLDLSRPGGGMDEERWKKLGALKKDQLQALAAFTPAQRRVLIGLGPKQEQVKVGGAPKGPKQYLFDEAKRLTPDQVKLLQKSAMSLDATIKKLQAEQEEAVKPLIKSLARQKPMPKGLETLDMRQTLQSGAVTLRRASLGALQQERVEVLPFVTPPQGPQTNPFLPPLQKLDKGTVAALQALRVTQLKRLKAASERLLADLKNEGPEQTDLWRAVSVESMSELGKLSSAQLDSLALLDYPTLQALDDTAAPKKIRDAASTLAWIAFIEVVIFFAVLLVGFAYLWRRGDLAWVRSTAAERVEPPVSAAPQGTMELPTSDKQS